MSARRDLYQRLMQGLSHSPDNAERASSLIDAFAHELMGRTQTDGARKRNRVLSEVWSELSLAGDSTGMTVVARMMRGGSDDGE